MRLFTKIFLLGTLVICLAFAVSGYFLLRYSFESSMAREVDFALKQYQYDKFTLQSAMLSYDQISLSLSIEGELIPEDSLITIWQGIPEGGVKMDVWGDEEEHGTATYYFQWKGMPGEDSLSPRAPDACQRRGEFEEILGDLLKALASEIGVPAAFYGEDGTPLYSEIEGLEASFLDELSEDSHVYRFRNTPEGGAVLVGSLLSFGEEKIGFVTQWDVEKTLRQQDTLRQYFIRCYLIAVSAGMALLFLLSALLTRPLKKMSKAARRMAEGDYKERFGASRGDEIGELAESFDLMADAVEEKIEELSRTAREKEDFVANFAHELKTPLTSIIGYADTIYQKELSKEEVNRAAWQIWNEGMRLEALSFKLMELTVLGRQDFALEEMSGDEVLCDVADGLKFLFAEKNIDFRLTADRAYIWVEYDLLKTLLMNLVDNAIKAGCGRIEMYGRKKEAEYWISVKDDGCGMEKEEISRITEAFYMVDKARSRRQHGAGLGLALADRIARIHGSGLMFASLKGFGTTVSFPVRCGEGGIEEDGLEEET